MRCECAQIPCAISIMAPNQQFDGTPRRRTVLFSPGSAVQAKLTLSCHWRIENRGPSITTAKLIQAPIISGIGSISVRCCDEGWGVFSSTVPLNGVVPRRTHQFSSILSVVCLSVAIALRLQLYTQYRVSYRIINK